MLHTHTRRASSYAKYANKYDSLPASQWVSAQFPEHTYIIPNTQLIAHKQTLIKVACLSISRSPCYALAVKSFRARCSLHSTRVCLICIFACTLCHDMCGANGKRTGAQVCHLQHTSHRGAYVVVRNTICEHHNHPKRHPLAPLRRFVQPIASGISAYSPAHHQQHRRAGGQIRNVERTTHTTHTTHTRSA